MGKLINRIPGLHLLISSLPGSASRTHVEWLGQPRDSTSVLKVLPGKLDIKRHSSSILYVSSDEKADVIIYFEWQKKGFIMFDILFYRFSGSLCEDMATIPFDPCSSDPCLHGGSCVNVTDGYHCQCTENFLGDRCEATIRHCIHDNPCKNGAVCEDHPEG